MLDKLIKLEAELWGFSATVLTPSQVAAMRELVQEWRDNNLEAINVNYVRFSSFGELGRKPSLEAAREAGDCLDLSRRLPRRQTKSGRWVTG